MITKNNFFKLSLLLLVVSWVTSCQKKDKPVLGNYPTDNVTLPAGNLRFFLSFDSTKEADKQVNIRFKDSISGFPSFFPVSAAGYDAGVKGTAYKGSSDAYLQYVNANDMGMAKSFTIALWMKSSVDQKDHTNADGVLAFANTNNFWGNFTIYTDHETSTSDSMILKIAFNTGNGNTSFDATDYTNNRRWPKMYDGNWHHVAFTYDATSSTFKAYQDGVVFDTKIIPGVVFDNPSKMVVGGFQEAVGVVSTYDKNTWMSGFSGLIDNVRLYNSVLAASDIAALFSNKQ